MTTRAPTPRTRLRRAHERGHYDRPTIDAVLDAGALAHVAYVMDGAPYVTPTFYWREGDHVYWHGSSASRMIRACTGAEVCVAVSHLDGFVLARSGFHHSANYRSVMLFGHAEVVADDAKSAHLDTFIERLFPGRVAELRAPTAKELKATTVLALTIDEASAKIRTGPPVDDEEDYGAPVWAGVLPLTVTTGAPQPCPRLAPETPLPPYVKSFRFGQI